ncbi:MAG: hypothetical protein AABX51_04185 [Nanoarchaeota archaeon]
MKKGDVTMPAIVGIILAIAALMVIMAAITVFYSKFNAGPADCRASNVLRGTARIDIDKGPFEFQQSVVPSACKTIDVELDGAKQTVMLGMADRITDCWWQWVNGKYDHLLCEKQGVNLEGLQSCDDSHCFACYHVLIKNIEDSKTREKTTFTGSELINFMRSRTKYWEDPETGELADQSDENSIPISYLDYIQYDERGQLFFSGSLVKENEVVFEPNTAYSIMYFEPHKESLQIGGEIGMVVGGAAGLICLETVVFTPGCMVVGAGIGGYLGSKADGIITSGRNLIFGDSDNEADKLPWKAIYVEKETDLVDTSKLCKVKYGYDGK